MGAAVCNPRGWVPLLPLPLLLLLPLPLLLLLPLMAAEPEGLEVEVPIVRREQWGAREPRLVEPMAGPVRHVIVHHSYRPPACSAPAACAEAVRAIQDMHMDANGWNDVGYSFLAGGDGRLYEGRGWSRVGAHAPKYNNRSIGICVIGDWTRELPPRAQLRAVRELVAQGVRRGHVAADYALLGHRQARPTECPGRALFRELRAWPHFSPCPAPLLPGQAEPGDPACP